MFARFQEEQLWTQVSSISNAENMWASVERRDDESTFVITVGEEEFRVGQPTLSTKAQIVFQSLGLQMLWIGGE